MSESETSVEVVDEATSSIGNEELVDLLRDLDEGELVTWDERSEPATVGVPYGDADVTKYGVELEGPRGGRYLLVCIPLDLGGELYRHRGTQWVKECSVGSVRRLERAP